MTFFLIKKKNLIPIASVFLPRKLGLVCFHLATHCLRLLHFLDDRQDHDELRPPLSFRKPEVSYPFCLLFCGQVFDHCPNPTAREAEKYLLICPGR